MTPFVRPLVTLLALTAMSSASPLWSRGGDNVLDEARLEKFAEKVNMLPFSQLPDPGAREITLEVNPDLDSKVIALGKACKGSFRPKTMVAPLARMIAGYWDADGDHPRERCDHCFGAKAAFARLAKRKHFAVKIRINLKRDFARAGIGKRRKRQHIDLFGEFFEPRLIKDIVPAA